MSTTVTELARWSKTQRCNRERTAALTISIRGMWRAESRRCDNAVMLLNAKCWSHTRSERVSQHDSVNNEELGQSLGPLCLRETESVTWEREPTCERRRKLWWPRSLRCVVKHKWDNAAGKACCFVCVQWFQRQTWKASLLVAVYTPPSLQIICLFVLVAFAQSRITSAAPSTFTLSEQLFWTFHVIFLCSPKSPWQSKKWQRTENMVKK